MHVARNHVLQYCGFISGAARDFTRQSEHLPLLPQRAVGSDGRSFANCKTADESSQKGPGDKVHSSSMLSKSYFKHMTIRHVYSHDGPHASVLTSAAGCDFRLCPSFVQPRPHRFLDSKNFADGISNS